MRAHATQSDWPWWAFAVVVAIVGAAAMAAGCSDDGTRCDPNQRLFHGLCYVIDAGADAGAAAGIDAAAAAVTPPGLPDTPPDPRSGSGG
jgi:hypothetical protein